MQRHRETASDRLWKEKLGSNISLGEALVLLVIAITALLSMVV